jgi:hypothetical protein
MLYLMSDVNFGVEIVQAGKDLLNDLFQHYFRECFVAYVLG